MTKLSLLFSLMTVQVVVNGILQGLVLALLGIGFNLIFGVMKFANFAHGAFCVLGMYLMFMLTGRFGIPPLLAGSLIVVMMFAAGFLFERFVLSGWMDRADEEMPMVLSVGLLVFIENVVLLAFGSDPHLIDVPLMNRPVILGSMYFRSSVFVAAAATLVVFLFGYLLLMKTRFGARIRAVADNKTGARIAGIRILRVNAMAFGISVAFAGIAGTVLSMMEPFSPFRGLELTLISFVIVVIGGMGSIPGSLLGGLLVGVLNSLGQYLVSESMSLLVGYVFLFATLLLRPEGLLAKGRGK